MKLFCVITADIVKSRKYLKSQQDIDNKVYKLNEKLKEELFTSFKISRGDEIQAVLKNIENLPKVIRNLRYYCRLFKLRIGIGIGDIEITEYSQNYNSWDMNGKAFYLARDSMDILNKMQKKHNTPYKKGYPATYIYSINQVFDLSFNAIYVLVDSIINNWDDKQWETIMLYESLGTYELVAEKLFMSRSAVLQRCDLANWRSIVSAEESLTNLIERMFLE